MMKDQDIIDLEEESKRLSEDRFERQKRISWWNQDLLKSSNVLVVGAGTLGNELCKNLALLGVGKISIIDNDDVEPVNLSRSILMREEDIGRNKAEVLAKRIKEIDSNIEIVPLNLDVVYQYGSANYRNFDLVLMTVDNMEARMYINRYCNMWNIPLINGGLDGLVCEVQVIQPPQTACYECTFSAQDYATIKEKYSCDGLMKSDPAGKIAMVITSAAIGAGLMSQEAVKLLHGANSSLAGRRAILDGFTNEFTILSVARNPNCQGHYRIGADNSLWIEYLADTTLRDLKIKVREVLRSDFQIFHDKSILYGGNCPSCGKRKDIMGLAGMIPEGAMFCENCRSFLSPDVHGDLRMDDSTLKDHGVPDNHVLTLALPGGQLKYIIPNINN